MQTKKWTVTCQLINGKMMYAVCRVKDLRKTLHRNNLDFATGYIESKLDASRIAKNLNGGNSND